MKRLIVILLGLFLCLSLAGCGSAGGKDTDQDVPVPDDKNEEAVETEEVIYDDCGVKITLLGYRKVPEDEPDEYGSAYVVKLRTERTVEQLQFSFLNTAVNGWLLSESHDPILRPREVGPEGIETELRIRRSFLEERGIEEVSNVSILFASKQCNYYTYDSVVIPLFSGNTDTELSSKTEGYYGTGMLVKADNPTEHPVRMYYLTKCADGEGHPFVTTDSMPGELVDGRVLYADIKPGAKDMPAALMSFDYDFWEYEGTYMDMSDVKDASAKFLYAAVLPFEDVSGQVSVPETKRLQEGDEHVYGYLDWPKELGRLNVYGTLLRYQNGELKDVASYTANSIDPEQEEKFLYFRSYDTDYSNETFETVINCAYGTGE